MKNTTIFLTALLLSMLFAGCKKEPTVANMTVVCVPLAGEVVDVSDLKAELHTTATYENLKYSFAVKGTAASATGALKDIVPGRYFLVVWKDMDNSLDFSKNDIFGFYPTALDLKAGDEKNLTVEMYIIE